MAAFRVSPAASQRLDEIFVHTRDTWAQDQAETYIRGLFACFERIARRDIVSRAIPAAFGVSGYCFRYEHHYVHHTPPGSAEPIIGVRQTEGRSLGFPFGQRPFWTFRSV